MLPSPLPLILFAASAVLAQSDTPLASKRIPYTAIPEKVGTFNGPRGMQSGYNRCNSTTEGPDSLCQTLMVNTLDDFCLWAPPEPNSTIAEDEAVVVSWCTKSGHGTRLIPPGALTGVQYIQTSDYVQITGHINQKNVDMAEDDVGGELDPHGADGAGNPMGGLVYSNAFPSNNGNNQTYQQVIEWNSFIGGNIFCIKICDPAGQRPADYCQHIYDRIGCAYNSPATYRDNVFEKCKGDNQDFPGVYTGPDGHVSTYSQPPESLGPITSMPYTARIPSSSDCTQYQSTDLYPAPGTPTASGSSSPTGSGAGSASRTGSSASPSNTSKGSGALGVVGPHVAAVLAVAALAVAAA